MQGVERRGEIRTTRELEEAGCGTKRRDKNDKRVGRGGVWNEEKR